MNGIVELKVKGKPLILKFGVQAAMLFQTIAAKNALDPQSTENHLKLMGDLFYAGLFGQALRSQSAVPTPEQAADIFDEFGEEKDFMAQMDVIWKVWTDSVWGQELLRISEEIGKKKAESEKQL